MIFTYMCRTCGCSFRSRYFGNIERFVEPCILLLLLKNASHGYGLMEGLEKHCGEKVDIGNLYRTLRKMETRGWIESSWDKNETGPDRRIYSITQAGVEYLEVAAASLGKTDKLIHHFFDGYQKHYKINKSI